MADCRNRRENKGDTALALYAVQDTSVKSAAFSLEAGRVVFTKIFVRAAPPNHPACSRQTTSGIAQELRRRAGFVRSASVDRGEGRQWRRLVEGGVPIR